MRMVKDTSATTVRSTPNALVRMDEIQQNMRSMCEHNYDEFHKTQNNHGFVTITIPKKTRR